MGDRVKDNFLQVGVVLQVVDAFISDSSHLYTLFLYSRTHTFTQSLIMLLAHTRLSSVTYSLAPSLTPPPPLPGLDTRSQMSLTGGLGLASSMSFGDDIDDALPNSARSRPGEH